MGYFDKLKEFGGKAVNVADKFTGTTSNAMLHVRKAVEGEKGSQSDVTQQERQFPFLGYTFYPGGGIGMKTTFLHDYIEHGGDNIAYADIRTIDVKYVASNNFMAGTAQATLMSGKTSAFAVKASDMELFYRLLVMPMIELMK